MKPENEAPAIDLAADVPETLTIVLRKPVSLGELTCTELVLREPLGHEWEQWDGLAGAASIQKAISVVAGVPMVLVRQIGTRDLIKAREYLDNFF